jgi:cold shock protein
MPTLTGKVAWFSAPKGFGFITRDDGQGDTFVHWKALEGMDGYKKLDQGQRVQFELLEGPKGKLQAEKVTVVR